MLKKILPCFGSPKMQRSRCGLPNYLIPILGWSIIGSSISKFLVTTMFQTCVVGMNTYSDYYSLIYIIRLQFYFLTLIQTLLEPKNLLTWFNINKLLSRALKRLFQLGKRICTTEYVLVFWDFLNKYYCSERYLKHLKKVFKLFQSMP